MSSDHRTSAKMAHGTLESKAISARNFAPTFAPRPVFTHVHEDTLRDALERAAFGPSVSVKDLAREVGCAEKTMYDKIHDPARLKVTELVEVVRLMASRGELEPLALMLEGTGYRVVIAPETPEEALDEEIAESAEEVGQCRRDIREGRFDKAVQSAMRAEHTAMKIVNTVQRLKSGGTPLKPSNGKPSNGKPSNGKAKGGRR